MPNIVKSLFILLIITVSFVNSSAFKVEDGKKFTVIIDAGHGGKDIGATDNGVMEKNINLKVAKELESLIKKKMKDVKVVMTRNDDSYLTLQERADKANKSQGDLFISIHTNSVDSKNKNRKTLAGSSVYTLGLHKDEDNLKVAMRENSVIELESDYNQKYKGFDPQKDESYIIFEMAQKRNLSQSIKFADYVEKELVNAGRENRGVHQAGFWVLWATSMPAVLVELDFLCNPQSAKYLSSDKGAKELANAIYKALDKYNSTGDKYVSDEKIIDDESIDIIGGIAVATARTRKTTAPEVKKNSTQSNRIKYANTGKRKRRSLNGKALSSNACYEDAKLGLNIKKRYDMVVETSNEELLSDVSHANESSKKKNDRKSEKKKKEKQKKNKTEKNVSHNAKVTKLVTVYKIQLLASEELLNQNNSRFCGLSPISTYKENNLYKYFYGESTDRKELEFLLTDVRKKIPDAFIVSSTKSVHTK